MHGFRENWGEARVRPHARRTSISVVARRPERERVRIGGLDGFDGRGGAVVRALLAEVIARLERAAIDLARGVSMTEALERLGEARPAARQEPAPVFLGAPLDALLDELSLALGALGHPVGARAARTACATASRIAPRAAARLRPRDLARDPALKRDVLDLFAGRLPAGFHDLLAVSTVLA